jgi:formate-dependent nitrite reductase membrane component NrfD
MWVGIVTLTAIVSLLSESVPAFALQVLWPVAVLVPALTAYRRARQQDWPGRSRRAAAINAVVAVIIGVAMLAFQLGRAVDDPLERFRVTAALVLAAGQPSWAVWSLYDSFMLYMQQRRR